MSENTSIYQATPDGGESKQAERVKVSGGEVHGCEAVDLSSVDYVPTKSLNGLFIGTGGDVKVDTVEGTGQTFKNLADGFFFPAHVTKVYKIGTDAEDIVAYWS